MKISIITAAKNSSDTIGIAIRSVQNQTNGNIEYIIVDGCSTDQTREIAHSFGNTISVILSEPDSGMYDAINKGIKLATGDIVGILNSDDFFYDKNVIVKIARAFEDPLVDAVFGDAVFVEPSNLSRVVRYYSSKGFRPWMFRFGFMPAHTTFFCRRELFEKLGYYRTDYLIAADFELLLRFFYTNKIRWRYLDEALVVMRTGGLSNKNLGSRVTLNREILKACRENKIRTCMPMVYLKYLLKVFEYRCFLPANKRNVTLNPGINK